MLLSILRNKYPEYSQFFEEKDTFIGGALQEWYKGGYISTEIVDITLKPYFKSNAIFEIEGKIFSCGVNLDCSKIRKNGEWIEISGYQSFWRFKSANDEQEFSSWSATIIGNDTDINRDFFLADNVLGLYIIADGVGKSNKSEVASKEIVQIVSYKIMEAMREKIEDPDKVLKNAIKAAVIWLHEKAKIDISLRKMSTTLTLLWIYNGNYFIANVGDSRAYLFRNSTLNQVTDDHSVAFEQFKTGSLTKEEIQTNPNQKMLTRCVVANSDFVVPDYFNGQIDKDTIFLLSTDGLNKKLTDSEIETILLKKNDIREAGLDLLRLAKTKEIDDDTTIIIVSA